MVLKVYLLTFGISLAKAHVYLCINMNVSLFSFILALIIHWLIIAVFTLSLIVRYE